jgi:hypothetical protein
VELTAVTVFCGASPGHRPKHLASAAELGGTLAGAGLRLVYGGARTGLMGAVADAALAAGGEVTGVSRPARGVRVGVRELSDPVRFTDAVDLLRGDGTDTFLELGPGEVLAGMLDAYPPPHDGTKGTPLVLALSRDRRLLLGG